jgi:hypothetical protein
MPTSPRTNPFRSGLPSTHWVAEHFSRIRTEASTRGVDLTEMGAFLRLTAVSEALAELQPAETELPRDGVSQAGAPSGVEALMGFGQFLYFAVHLDSDPKDRDVPGDAHQDAPLLLELTPAEIPGLLERAEGGGGVADGPLASRIEFPSRTGYLRLPKHRFWSYPAGHDNAPEALDGIAWVCRASAGAGTTEVLALGITGWIPERPGFSIIPLPPFPVAEAPVLESSSLRPPDRGADFESNMEGGSFAGLYSLETPGEFLKLLFRAIRHEMTPGSIEEGGLDSSWVGWRVEMPTGTSSESVEGRP